LGQGKESGKWMTGGETLYYLKDAAK